MKNNAARWLNATCYGFRGHMYHGENFEKISNIVSLDVYS